MKKYFFTLVISLLFSFGIKAQENSKYINEKAEKFVEAEKYKEALKEYNNCVKNFENETKYFKVEVLLNKAKVENKLKEYAQAEKTIQDAINVKKNIHKIYIAQAEILATQNKCKEAAIAIDTALFYNKEETELLIRKSGYQMKALMLDSSLSTINSYILLEPKNLSAYVFRSSVYLTKKEYEKGLEDVNYVLNKNPDNLEALLNRGTLLSELKEYDKAEKDYYRIIELNHDYKEASLNNIVFFIKFKKQDYAGALEILNKAILEFPDEAYLINNRGYANLMLKNYKEAEKDITTSIKLNPYNSFAYKYLGQYYLALNKKNKACENFDKAIALGYTTEYDNDVQDLKNKNCK